MAAAKKKAKKRKVTKKPSVKKTKVAGKSAPKTKKKTTKKVAKKKVTKSKTPAKKKAAKKKVAKKKTTAKKAVTKKKVAKKKVVKKKTAKQKATKQKVTKKKQPAKKVVKKAAKKKTPVKKAPRQVVAPVSEVKPKSQPVEVDPYATEKGEEYMSDAQLEHFREILLRWKGQLMREVDSTVVHMKEEAISYPDPLDRASQEEGFNLELRTRDRERKLIKKIEYALDAIETGEYGYCESCGAEIGIRRLEARPTADKCIDCKTFEEIREKQSGG